MVLFWSLLILAGLQLAAAALVYKFLHRAEAQVADDAECPRALVILSLRGADPFLSDVLAALFEQDYPNYQVEVVVDSRDDPAWDIVESVLQKRPAKHVRVSVLESPRSTCTLKLSA